MLCSSLAHFSPSFSASGCWWLNQQKIILNMDCYYVISNADNKLGTFLPTSIHMFRLEREL